MFYHSIRTLATALPRIFGSMCGQNGQSQRRIDFGSQGSNMNDYRHGMIDSYDLASITNTIIWANPNSFQEENGYLAHVPTVVDEGDFRIRRPRRRFRRSYKLPCLKFSTEVAILAAFGIMVVLSIVLPLMEGLGSSFDYAERFNITAWNEAHSANATHQPSAVLKQATPAATKYQAIETATVPGFYLMPAADLPVQVSSVTSRIAQIPEATFTVKLCYTTTYIEPKTVLHELLRHESQPRSDPPEGELPKLRHAYPVHGPQAFGKDTISDLRAELESCAHNILSKLQIQDAEIARGLEFLLHDCQAVFDEASGMVAKQSSQHIRNNKKVTRQPLAKSGPTAKTHGDADVVKALHVNSSDQCVWKRPASFLVGQTCSKNFCNWTSTGDYSRCYEKNNTWSADQGGRKFLNDGVDDFKTGAPLECNLCLPSIDCEGIDVHCNKVETAEYAFLTSLLLALLTLVVYCTALLLIERW